MSNISLVSLVAYQSQVFDLLWAKRTLVRGEVFKLQSEFPIVYMKYYKILHELSGYIDYYILRHIIRDYDDWW